MACVPAWLSCVQVEDASWTSLGLILPVASERFIGMGQAKVVTAGKG